MAQSPEPPDAVKSIQVFVRFGLRISALCFFATLGNAGFGRSMIALLGLSTILCGIAATLRREPPLNSTLTYWDEGAAYGALYCLATIVNQPTAY